ncbi:hypothetical protein Fcan01_00089, partial [Folsomia candida]
SAEDGGELFKMPTRLAYQALSLTFTMNSYLSRTPIEFDGKKRRFKYTKITRENIPRYAPWLSAIFFLFYFLSIGCAWYVILRQIVKPNPRIKVKQIFGYVMMNTAGTIVIGATIYVLKSGEEAVQRINWLVRRYEEMFPEDGVDVPSAYPIWRLNNGELDTFGVAVFAMLGPLPVVPFLATVFGMMENLDVYQYVLQDVIPAKVFNNLWTQIVLRSISAIMIYDGFAESARILAVMGMLVIAPTQLIVRIVRGLSRRDIGETGRIGDHPIKQIQQIYSDYAQLKIIEVSFHGFEATLAFELIECGIWLAAAALFATLKLHQVFPLGFYVMFPFFAFAILGISQQLIPVCSSMHENSVKALTKWTAQVSSGGNGAFDKKYFRKKFRPLRPLRIVAGFRGFIIFVMDKSMKTYFLQSILDNTINLLISLPELETSQVSFQV